MNWPEDLGSYVSGDFVRPGRFHQADRSERRGHPKVYTPINLRSQGANVRIDFITNKIFIF